MKKLIVMAMFVVLTLPVMAKGNDKEPITTIGMSISTLNNPFFANMKEAAQQQAKKMGYKIVVLDAQNDATKERANIDDLLQRGIGVLIINPTDSDAAKVAVQMVIKKGIPVVSVDRAVNGVEVATHIASDNVAGGALAATFVESMFKKGQKVNVVELQGVPGASATRDRGAGFESVVNANSTMSIVSAQSANFDRGQGLTVMENIIQANPNIDVVFAHNDEMALGALRALKMANKNIPVVGFDGTKDAVKSIEKGGLVATVAQQEKLMGEMAVTNAIALLKGEKVNSNIPVDLKLIKK